MEVLYGTVSNGARRLTVQEFLHCYHPDEIAQSKGMYTSCLGALYWGLCVRPLTPIGIRRVDTFSWKVTDGYVVLVIMNLCLSTPHRAYCHRLVCIRLYWASFLFCHVILIVFFYNSWLSTSLYRRVEFSGEDFCQVQTRGKDVGKVGHTRHYLLVLRWTRTNSSHPSIRHPSLPT